MFDLEDSHEWLFHLAAQRRDNHRPPKRAIILTALPPKIDAVVEDQSVKIMVARKRLAAIADFHEMQRLDHWSVKFQTKFSAAVKGKGNRKVIEHLLGYSIVAFRIHMEKQFLKGMSWDNYAGNCHYLTKKKTWHIDHIVPKSTFSIEDVRLCYAFSNLRPLWSKDNVFKSNKRTHLL